MKHRKILFLKSSLSALALAFVLWGGSFLPGTAFNGPEPSPFPVEEDGSVQGNDNEEDGSGIQPLSDLDEIKKLEG